MSNKLLKDFGNVRMALDLIELGARIQVLEYETGVSRGKLVGLYKEFHGKSPSKGLLPFSTEWFMTWLPNIHASLFYGIYSRLLEQSKDTDKIAVLAKAYRLYKDQVAQGDEEPLMDITRAWTMLRFFESKMLDVNKCQQCEGQFIVHSHTPSEGYLCGLCMPPSRAGKTKSKSS